MSWSGLLTAGVELNSMDYVSRGTFWSVKMHFDWNGASINGCMICGLDYQGYIFCIRWSGINWSGAFEASSMWSISMLSVTGNTIH